MFLSFEGLDGSGKSTQVRLLAGRLRTYGQAVRVVREPGGPVLSEAIRTLLLDPSLAIEPTAELLLFSAARAQLVETEIKPALARGEIVIADRFYDSTTAYQGGGRGVAGVDWLRDFHPFVTGRLAPRRTYLLDVPAEVAADRRRARAGVEDRMEAAGEAFFARVRDAYLALAASEPGRFCVLDGRLPPEALHDQVGADLARLGGRIARILPPAGR
jgi:dTMP kinase